MLKYKYLARARYLIYLTRFRSGTPEIIIYFMSRLQDVFNRIQKTKKEQKEIKAMYRDALANSYRYQELIEEIKALKEKKKKMEEAIQDDFRSEFNKLETLKTDIENDVLLMSDLAINKLMKGETVEIVDEKDNKYEPTFSVRFKKAA